ncbi:MAG: hypothetical protein ACK4N5_22230, partial [Myxococcales bacterium]
MRRLVGLVAGVVLGMWAGIGCGSQPAPSRPVFEPEPQGNEQLPEAERDEPDAGTGAPDAGHPGD